MTDSENSVPHDDSDEDIYKDVSDFDFERETDKVEATTQDYANEVNDLTEKVKVLNEENEKLKKLNTTLEKNLSTLLKTAQAEVQRKDFMIDELRVEIDSLTFRRKSKSTKDKYTNTEEWESLLNLASGNKECKCGREPKSPKREDGRDKEHRFSKTDQRKSRQKSSGCDSKNVYSSGDIERGSTEKTSDGLGDSCKENPYSLREKNVTGSTSYRRNQRDHFKYSPDERKRHSRRTDNFRYSPYKERDSRRGNLRKRDLEERPVRNSRRDRSRSPPRDRLRNNKKRSPEKQNSENATEKISRNKKNDRSKSKERDVEFSKNAKKKRALSQERANARTESTQYKNEKTDIKSNIFSGQFLGKKSLPDELAINDVNTPRHSVIKSDLEYQEKEDWKLSFKNERSDDNKPMTLYSKRMMQKLSIKAAGDINHEKTEGEKAKERTQTKYEKEPGELTDDENVIEESKEFREVAKTASESMITTNCVPISNREFITNQINVSDEGSVQNVDEKEPISERKKDTVESNNGKKKDAIESNGAKFNDFQTPFPIDGKLLFSKPAEATRDNREVIEFSPFKNNYKLIEITPTQVPKNNNSSNNRNQKTVEKSIFNLLSRLSGVPVDPYGSKSHENHDQDKKVGSKTATIITPKPLHCDQNNDKQLKINVDSTISQKKTESENLVEANKISKKKSISIENYWSKKQGKKEELKKFSPENKINEREDAAKAGETQADDASPGETTQFLNFFLLTTSPSKPILPAEEELLLRKSQEKCDTNSFKQGSESDDAPSLNNSSDTKEDTGKKQMDSNRTSRRKQMKSNVRNESTTTIYTEKETNFEGPNTGEDIKGQLGNCNEKVESPGEKPACEPLAAAQGLKEIKTEKGRRKRKISDKETTEYNGKCKKTKTAAWDNAKRGRKNENDSKSEEHEDYSEEDGKTKEDISFFEFFKPIIKKNDPSEKGMDDSSANGDVKMTATMSVTGVVHLETPNKCVEKLKNFVINEQTIYQVLETKNNSSYSSMVGAKMVEMTPRRMLKNDLMLTDSEDDSGIKNQLQTNDDEEEREENVEMSPSENSDCESDSGASDFVDQL